MAQLAQEPANRVGMRLSAGRIFHRTGQFGHGHVAVLINQLKRKGAMRIKLALATKATLRRETGLSSAPDRGAPTRAPVVGESFQRNAAARPHNPPTTNL